VGINLSHGAVIVFGMFALYFLAAHGFVYTALPIVIITGFGFGFLLYWIAVHRVIGQQELMSLLATFAVNMIMIGIGTALWSTSPYNSRSPSPASPGRATPLLARIL